MHDPILREHQEPLTDRDFTAAADPFVLFRQWLAEASASEPADPNAMALATVDPDGLPDVRIVLMKSLDERGFAFFTNEESAKGRELAATPKAALNFHWKSLARQVRVRGPVERVSEGEADAYFASRPRVSQIGAWASQQSRPVDSRAAFETAVAQVEQRFAGQSITRPPHWGGFRVVPQSMEFWQDRPFRLHDRVVFRRSRPGGDWQRTRLFP